MRLSQLLTSHRSRDDDRSDLLAYAGYTHRLMDGAYSLLPLGHRVLQRIVSIVRREMSRIGAQEVSMPLLQPEELWQRHIGGGDTRASSFGAQLFRILTHDDRRLILAPTHEEVAALLGALCIRDARDLPRVFYQIQPRFRDQESAAESGLLHTREFVMADTYSFHADRASLDESYAVIKDAFCRVATACGVHADLVSADAGVMGGEESEELAAPLPNSRATAAVHCTRCGYAASVEIAEFARPRSNEEPLGVEEIAVPDGLSVDEVGRWLGEAPAKRLTWTLFVSGERVVLAVLPGDLSLNHVKLLHALSQSGVEPTGLRSASAEDLRSRGMNYESISLVRTPSSVTVIADEGLRSSVNFFIPSTRAGHFLINVNAERDFRVDAFADLAVAGEGAPCSKCGAGLRAISGIELGHVFKLGSLYTAAFGAEIASSEGLRMPIEMGCYGLGITRLMATIVEQTRDARGIVWPESVAPYLAVVLPLSTNGEIRRAAEQLYADLSASGLDVLLDDTGDPPADQVRNADLLGIPLQIVFSGDVAADGSVVEIRERKSGNTRRAPTKEILAFLRMRNELIDV